MIQILTIDNKIDLENGEIRRDLRCDLRRMTKLKHEYAPVDSNAFVVRVSPSTRTYGPGMYRFNFEIQYGYYSEGFFEKMNEEQHYQTETLPMI